MTTLIETAPARELRPHDIANVVDELHAYHAISSPLFQRRQQCEWASDSLHGLLWDIRRTSIEPMVLTLRGDDANAIRAMQQFISERTWADRLILERHWCEVDQTLGDADGVLTLDGSDFLPQGQESVGVKRQDCSEVGKRVNCQAGVCLSSASLRGYTLVDRRLSLPNAWGEDEAWTERRHTCGVPQHLTCKTKPQLGWEMIRAVVDPQVLRCRWVTCDEAFGWDTAFLEQMNFSVPISSPNMRRGGLLSWRVSLSKTTTQQRQRRPPMVDIVACFSVAAR